ncbi:hypothetical protein [uncultured Paludibaculum sp.]|uniref:hypothetical protein n=1 Tax=uncultured Paludibaculum sp. TaxID=1765020 RepID=UPI002AABBBAF|nr:hypothetical protein [uncultured Paludibaculum sp.]
MKITFVAARALLGLIFTVFGLNGFLHFLPMQSMPQGVALQFVTALAESHYMTVVFALQLGTGVLLLLNRYVPVALTLLAPVIVNIVLFHILMAPAGLPLAIVVTVLWMVTAYSVRPAFQALFHTSVHA